MRLLKSNSILSLANSYIVDSPQPSSLSYLWNFGSLLAVCLGLQIVTGVFLAMHYTPNVELAFTSVEHIMRDVNLGWAIRYTHANVASFFFIFVYVHIGRGLYYGSYKSPRVLPWTIGVIILVLMMANLKLWPNWGSDITNIIHNNSIMGAMLPFGKARTKAFIRIGPHDKQVLDIIICGMLGDFWADKIPGKQLSSIRFNLEQSISNSAYIHHINLLLYNLGYCAQPTPSLIKKSDRSDHPEWKSRENRFNYKLSLFTFTSFLWIYDSYYIDMKGKNRKCVPYFISDYLSPLGLAHWIMQDGSNQRGQGINLATHSFTFEECQFLARVLTDKYNFKTSVIKTGVENQWRISIWKQSMPTLIEIVKPYMIPEMLYKLYGQV